MPETPAPVIDAPIDPETPAAKKSLDDLLAGLDDDARGAVLGEVEKARKEAAGYRTKLRETEPLAKKAQELLDAQKSAEEKANEKTSWAEAKAAGYRDRAVQAEVKALAATDFADPEDASAFLDLSSYVDDDGDIDTSAIKADLTDLLTRKPHLARSDRPGPRPDRSQGSGGNGAQPSEPKDVFAAFIKNQLPQ